MFSSCLGHNLNANLTSISGADHVTKRHLTSLNVKFCLCKKLWPSNSL